jgi:hypothetical protein
MRVIRGVEGGWIIEAHVGGTGASEGDGNEQSKEEEHFGELGGVARGESVALM